MLINVFEKAELDCQMIFQDACANLLVKINHGLESKFFLLGEEYGSNIVFLLSNRHQSNNVRMNFQLF